MTQLRTRLGDARGRAEEQLPLPCPCLFPPAAPSGKILMVTKCHGNHKVVAYWTSFLQDNTYLWFSASPTIKKQATLRLLLNVQKLNVFSLGRMCPLIPRPGALPLDPTTSFDAHNNWIIPTFEPHQKLLERRAKNHILLLRVKVEIYWKSTEINFNFKILN